jgi:hypothetical protein
MSVKGMSSFNNSWFKCFYYIYYYDIIRNINLGDLIVILGTIDFVLGSIDLSCFFIIS